MYLKSLDVEKQQRDTKKFFEKTAKTWDHYSKKHSKKFLNIIKIRNDYVLDVVKKQLKKKSKTLDVGCGTGDLVIELENNGVDSIGIDFSQSMIKKAKANAKKNKVNPKKFEQISFFDFKPEKKFDLISANGFVEYISELELEKFIEKSKKMINKNGILVFQIRNRLFNCFSLNDYTLNEIKIGEINHLLDECVFFNNLKKFKELQTTKEKSKCKLNLKKHVKTGNEMTKILVSKRLQYTPLQIIEILKRHNFKIIDINPIHIHPISTGGKNISPILHTKLSNFLQKEKKIKLTAIPLSSSVMITAKNE